MVSSLSSVLPTSQVFTSCYVNTEIILNFFYKITNDRGTKPVFTYAHVKWFYGHSERAYYSNYFIMSSTVYTYHTEFNYEKIIWGHVASYRRILFSNKYSEKKTPWERLPKVTDWKIYACSDIDLGEVLFHYVVFCNKKKKGSFEQDLSCFLRRNFLRFGVPLNIFVPFLVPVDKKKFIRPNLR